MIISDGKEPLVPAERPSSKSRIPRTLTLPAVSKSIFLCLKLCCWIGPYVPLVKLRSQHSSRFLQSSCNWNIVDCRDGA